MQTGFLRSAFWANAHTHKHIPSVHACGPQTPVFGFRLQPRLDGHHQYLYNIYTLATGQVSVRAMLNIMQTHAHSGDQRGHVRAPHAFISIYTLLMHSLQTPSPLPPLPTLLTHSQFFHSIFCRASEVVSVFSSTVTQNTTYKLLCQHHMVCIHPHGQNIECRKFCGKMRH